MLGLNKMTIRTRFAPSPTGCLHVGSVRTALYCWLYAKRHDGRFLLRIEDTDKERSTQNAVDVILAGMKWLGLDWDEGPIYQTHRLVRYQAVVQQLINSGAAYRCYCSKGCLNKLRNEQMANKQKPRYDGRCRDKIHEKDKLPHVIRFKNPKDGKIVFQDVVRGEVIVQNLELDDFIIVRTDGTPTYNFTVVVDDNDMGISMVIRGEDHISNTPKQINLLNALNYSMPQFAHIPMILGDDGKRLSKRHGAVSVLEYRERGILPEALLNYLVRLGWSYGDQEIFTIEEMQQKFDIDAVNKAAAALNDEKLLWLNQHYLKSLPSAKIVDDLQWQCDRLKIDVSHGPKLEEVVLVQRERSKTLLELIEKSRYFYEEFECIDSFIAKKHLKPVIYEALIAVRNRLAERMTWNCEMIHQKITEVAVLFSLKFGKLAQPIRVSVTGKIASPPIDVTLMLIGQRRVIERLDRAIGWIDIVRNVSGDIE